MRPVIAGGHVIDVVAHQLTDDRANTVTAVLKTFGLPVTVETDVFGTVHMHALKPTDTAGEFHIIAAFNAVTDSPLAYHQAVRS